MIDLRSDTVTRPSLSMREAMAAAEVGDDMYGEDPTVNHLQDLAAEMMGKEAALFVASGTQGNLLGVFSHCERGDEFILGARAHTFWNEGGGATVLTGAQPQTVPLEDDGTLDLDAVESVIKPRDIHHTRTKLLALENTIGGQALPLKYLPRAAELARRYGLGTHLDGARVFNAAIKQEINVSEITQHFDTVSFCLSKGLGAPVGSILCGKRELIKRAHRWRKTIGGAMRQVGLLAAAGIYALENNVSKLAEDHRNASVLASGLTALQGLEINYSKSQTNMVFMSLRNHDSHKLVDFARENGILLHAGNPMRLVLHLDVSARDVNHVVTMMESFLAC